MDPQASLTEMLRAIRDGRSDDAFDCFEALAQWLSRNGAVPDITRAFTAVSSDDDE